MRRFPVLGYAYLWIKQQRINRFLAATDRSPEIQRELLLEKIRRNADSDFGRDHGFGEIRNVDDFRRRVPVADYEYYRPYVERVKKGDIRAMFGPGVEVLMFSMTSGTTSASKYIPITNDFYGPYRKSWNLWGLGVFRDHVDLCRKGTIQLSSDWQQFHTEGGIACGNVSGLAAETRPRISRRLFVLPPAVNKIRGATNKQYAVLRLTLARPYIGMMVTANPLTLINIAQLANEHRESLIRDLYNGTISDFAELPSEARRKLQPALAQKHPKRARELERIIEQTGTLYPKDFWPLMSVISVWTGGSVGVYLPKLKEYYGDVAFRDHGLSASEGRMTTPFSDGTSAGVLDYVTNFFEFIPEEEIDSADPTVMEAHELEVGRDYFILLTTSGGLYRYDIHDVVKCVGYEGMCPVLDFQNKGAHYCSMAGEKLAESQVTAALSTAHAEMGLPLEHCLLAPVAGTPAHYALLTEQDLSPAQGRELAQGVDRNLSQINCEYEDRLLSLRLDRAEVLKIPKGTFAALREKRIARRGGSPEQYKHPWLVNRTDFVDEILELQPLEPVFV